MLHVSTQYTESEIIAKVGTNRIYVASFKNESI